MSLPDADRYAREQIDYHREQMADWKVRRAERIAADRKAGKTVEEIAEELGLKPVTVYEVLRALPPLEIDPGKPRRGRPRKSTAPIRRSPRPAPEPPEPGRRPPLVAPIEEEGAAHDLVSEPFQDPA